MRSQDEVVDFAEPVAIDLFVHSAELHVDTRQVANHEVQASCDRVVFRGSSEREVPVVVFLRRTCSLLDSEGMRQFILEVQNLMRTRNMGDPFGFLLNTDRMHLAWEAASMLVVPMISAEQHENKGGSRRMKAIRTHTEEYTYTRTINTNTEQ